MGMSHQMEEVTDPPRELGLCIASTPEQANEQRERLSVGHSSIFMTILWYNMGEINRMKFV